MAAPTTSPRLRGWLITLFCVVVFLGIAAYPLVQIYLAIRWSVEEMEREAVKATPLVDAIYGYRKTHGTWPRQLENVGPDFTLAMSEAGWEYTYVAPPEEIALLRLFGPCHTQLLFVFVDDSDPATAPDWRCTMEGDPVEFDVHYQPQE